MKLAISTKHSALDIKGMSHRWLSQYVVALGTQQTCVRTIPWQGEQTSGLLRAFNVRFEWWIISQNESFLTIKMSMKFENIHFSATAFCFIFLRSSSWTIYIIQIFWEHQFSILLNCDLLRYPVCCHLILTYWDQQHCTYLYLDCCMQLENFHFGSICFPPGFFGCNSSTTTYKHRQPAATRRRKQHPISEI